MPGEREHMTPSQIDARRRLWQHMLSTQLMPACEVVIMQARIELALWHLARA